MSDSILVSEPGRSVEHLINAVAGLVRGSPVLSAGDAASLRRMDPRRPSAAFFKIEGLLLDELLPGDATKRASEETKWAAVVLGLAHLGDLHRAGSRLGTALASAGYSELRFVRLLEADSEQLLDELPSLARFLAAKGVPVDWVGAARLVFSAGRADEETARRHVARDYYGTIARQEKA